MGDRRPSRPASVLLTALVVVAAFLLWLSARRVGTWTPDEEYFVHTARAVAEGLPWSLVDLPMSASDDRGLQRLTFGLLAVPLGTLGGVAGFEIARALMCLAFAGAAVPAYLLARGIRLSHGWSLAAAALSVMVPWAVLTSTFLAESVAYPAALWAIYGAWRATVVRGVRADLVALGLVAVAGLARTNLLVLVGVAPAAVGMVAVLEARSAGRRGRAGRALRALRADHPVLGGVLVAGLAALVLNAAGVELPAALSGGYETTLKFDLDVLPDKWSYQLAALALGVGVLPAILAPPWAARAIARGPRPERGLALCCALGVALVLVSTIYAAPEERYLMAVAPLVVVPAVAALARREVPAWSVALTGAVVALLIGTRAWMADPDFARFVTFSAESVFTRVVLSRLDQLGVADPRVLAGLLVLVLTTALVVLVSGRLSVAGAARGSVVALALLGVFQVAQSTYAVNEYATRAAGPADLRERTWVDRLVGDAEVAMQAEAISNGATYQPIFREVGFWNRRPTLVVGRAESLVAAIPRFGAGVTVRVERTGRLRAVDGRALPSWFLVPTLFRALGLLGEPVARSSYLPLELVRLNGAPRATFSWSGSEPDGWLTEGAPAAEARLFEAARVAAPRPCLTFTLIAPAPVVRPHRFVVTAGARRVAGGVGSGERRTVQVPLRPGLRRVAVRTSGGFLDADGRRLGLQIAEPSVASC